MLAHKEEIAGILEDITELLKLFKSPQRNPAGGEYTGLCWPQQYSIFGVKETEDRSNIH